MVCDKCQKKLISLATPDVHEGYKRAVGVNKIIQKKARTAEIAGSIRSKCRNCQTPLAAKGKYCPSCAYKLGKCSMCGKKVFNTTSHCMSLV